MTTETQTETETDPTSATARDPKDRKTLEDAFNTARAIIDLAENPRDAPCLPVADDMATLAYGFMLLCSDLAGYWEAVAQGKHYCGWCEHAGLPRAELPQLSLEEIREHTLACEHNPLVRQLAEARAACQKWQDHFTDTPGLAQANAEIVSLQAEVDRLKQAGIEGTTEGYAAAKNVLDEWSKNTAEMKALADKAMAMATLAVEQRDIARAQILDAKAENDRLMSILGLSMSSTHAERLERLNRMEPLRTVLRSYDWKEIAEDGRLPDEHCERVVIRAFAHVERDENEAAKAKEADHG